MPPPPCRLRPGRGAGWGEGRRQGCQLMKQAEGSRLRCGVWGASVHPGSRAPSPVILGEFSGLGEWLGLGVAAGTPKYPPPPPPLFPRVGGHGLVQSAVRRLKEIFRKSWSKQSQSRATTPAEKAQSSPLRQPLLPSLGKPVKKEKEKPSSREFLPGAFKNLMPKKPSRSPSPKKAARDTPNPFEVSRSTPPQRSG